MTLLQDERGEARRDLAYFDKIDMNGMETIAVIAKYFDLDVRWLEHITFEFMSTEDGCKCTFNMADGGEIVKECPKWVAIKRYKDAEAALERAKKELESASANLDGYM